MTLKLYNTRTKRKEEFEPLDPGNVRMYVCGPTVYDLAHIGNARPIIVFDVLFRLLRHTYGADKVTYVRNITDVDDKINARAAERGIPIGELTAETTAQFHADVAALGCLPPTVEPRATLHIPEMIAMIGLLIARGYAYAAEGHVLFSVSCDPRYGSLSRRSVDEMRAGARIDVAPYKRDPMDFVLWKPSASDEPGWESPWGRGRPGWHIECSAMAAKHLGETFDIHGGGVDLVFPHHENELAQSTCAHGSEIMANIWMHNGHLQVEGAKMSKSTGNFVTIRDLLETDSFAGRSWHGKVIRFAMLTSHYRQPMDWTTERLFTARTTLFEWTNRLHSYGDVIANDPYYQKLDEYVEFSLNDDLNTPALSARFHELWNCGLSGWPRLAYALHFLGLLSFAEREDLVPEVKVTAFEDSDYVKSLVEARLDARRAKNWAEADRIRDELAAMGIELKDAKDPATGEIVTTWATARR